VRGDSVVEFIGFT